jgi:hypothetical protein
VDPPNGVTPAEFPPIAVVFVTSATLPPVVAKFVEPFASGAGKANPPVPPDPNWIK